MKVNTYGVPDLTEWHGKLKAGNLEVSVSFVGGTRSPGGTQPAYYMTKDPIVQFIIENSREFKSGFIIRTMSQEIEGEHPHMAKPNPVQDKAVNVENPKPTTDEEVKEGNADENAPIEVADKSDAIEYLKERFPDKGFSATSLRTKAAFDAACLDCGVEFVFRA